VQALAHPLLAMMTCPFRSPHHVSGGAAYPVLREDAGYRGLAVGKMIARSFFSFFLIPHEMPHAL
jgi:hypothetical protein